MRACRRGSDAAARALLERLGPALTVYARSIVRDPALADDVVQSALCRMFRVSVREIDRVQHPPGWLAQIVRREALSMMRSESRRRARARAWALGAGSRGAEREVGEMAEISAQVAAMPRRLSEVVILRHVSALTFDQIAAATGINRSTIASRYKEAIERLKGGAGVPASRGGAASRAARAGPVGRDGEG